MSKRKALVLITTPEVTFCPLCIACGEPLPADWPFGELNWHKPCLVDALYAAKGAEKRNRRALKALREEALRHYELHRDEPLQSDTAILSFRPVFLASYTTQDKTYTEVHAAPRKCKSIKPIEH